MLSLREFGSHLAIFLEGLFSLALTVTVLIPGGSILYLLNQIPRLLLSLYLLVKFKGRMCICNYGLDNIWGYETPGKGNSRNILFVAIYKEVIDGERYRRKFLSDVINFVAPGGYKPYFKLKQILKRQYGYYCWVEDENFDIKNHIIVLDDKEIVTESQVMKMLTELSKNFDDTRPQWQEIIIPRFKYDISKVPDQEKEQSIRILRSHHAYGDAGSWILLYSYCMGGGKLPYAVNPLKGYPAPLWQKALYYTNFVIFGATTAIKNAWKATFVSNRLVTNRYNGVKHFAWTDIIDLQLLKEIKKKTETSIPTLVASLVAGALRSFDDKYPRIKNPTSLKKGGGEIIRGIGDEIQMGAVAAILPYPNLHLQNRFTVANILVPTGEMSPLIRLNLTHKNGLRLAHSPEPLVNYYLFKYFGRMPAFVQDFMLKSCGTSLIFSNLPGASREFDLMGDIIADGGGFVPLLINAGLAISASGYRDGIRFLAVTDSACMSEAQLKFILSEIRVQLNLLAEETIGLS